MVFIFVSSEMDFEEDVDGMKIDVYKMGWVVEYLDFVIIWLFLENFRYFLYFFDLFLDDLEDGFNSYLLENGNWRLFIL